MVSISLGAEPVREHAACEAREPERLGGVIALVGDRDDAVAEPEGEQ